MARHHHTPESDSLEDAVTALFCIVDDTYRHISPQPRRYSFLKRLSDSEVLTLALVQQLREVESSRSFLRDAGRFLHELFSGRGGSSPFLVSLTCKETRALSRTFEAQCALRARGRTRDSARGFDLDRGLASKAGFSVGG